MKFNPALGSALALCLLAGTAQAQQLTTTRITSGRLCRSDEDCGVSTSTA